MSCKNCSDGCSVLSYLNSYGISNIDKEAEIFKILKNKVCKVVKEKYSSSEGV